MGHVVLPTKIRGISVPELVGGGWGEAEVADEGPFLVADGDVPPYLPVPFTMDGKVEPACDDEGVHDGLSEHRGNFEFEDDLRVELVTILFVSSGLGFPILFVGTGGSCKIINSDIWPALL